MTDTHRYNHFVIFALILIVGLGFGLALPWLANAQGLVAQNELGVNAPEATMYYVAITGTGSPGTSWTDAFTNVQDALAVAVNPAEIWVAKGVYYPDVGSGQINDSVTATFLMTDGVSIFGGFNFNDTDINDRDWENNKTVLSGDVDGDDIVDTDGVVLTTTDIVDDNAYHVVTAIGVTGMAELDGFTITAGQADGNEPDDYGGGFYCGGSKSGNVCSPSLKNVIFSGNWAEYGGAMYNAGNDGGDSSPMLINVTFSGNSAKSGGGAMYNWGTNGRSSPRLINVTFSGNSEGKYGGGAMYNDGANGGDSSPSLINVIFSGNSAEEGGAMYNWGIDGTCSPTMTNVTFSGNSASKTGGAIYNNGISGGTSSPDVRNSIFWNNQDSTGTDTISATIYNLSATITLSNSLVEDSDGSGSGWIGGSYIDGGGNIDKDPMFVTPVNPATAPTTAGDLRLQEGSPAIDAGDNDYVDVPTDLDGEPRITDGDGDFVEIVDMGAYETPSYYKYVYLPLINH